MYTLCITCNFVSINYSNVCFKTGVHVVRRDPRSHDCGQCCCYTDVLGKDVRWCLCKCRVPVCDNIAPTVPCTGHIGIIWTADGNFVDQFEQLGLRLEPYSSTEFSQHLVDPQLLDVSTYSHSYLHLPHDVISQFSLTCNRNMENCAAMSQMKFTDITHCHVSDILQLYILQYVVLQLHYILFSMCTC